MGVGIGIAGMGLAGLGVAGALAAASAAACRLDVVGPGPVGAVEPSIAHAQTFRHESVWPAPGGLASRANQIMPS